MAKRRDIRLGLVTALALVIFIGLFWLFDQYTGPLPAQETSQTKLWLLSMAVVIVALGLVGILVRNLVRLILDRKRGILGSRLRTKLVFFFLALLLLPSIVLFTGSAQVINRTVEALLRTQLEDLTRQSGDVWKDYFQDQCLDRARGIAEEIENRGLLKASRGAELNQLIETWLSAHELSSIAVMDGSRVLARRISDEATVAEDQLDRLTGTLIEDVNTVGESASRIDIFADSLLAHAVQPIAPAGRRTSTPIVSVGIVLPESLADNLAGLASAEQQYRRFRVGRRATVRFYMTLVGLIFLVTVFIATWMGFYVSRRITVPIQDMAAAAREISTGNLDVRVQTEIGDEVGMLVEAFNEMAGELQENREVITRSTSDLRSSNRALDERRRYIETLLANLSTAVLSLDAEGRVTTANPAVDEILGFELVPGDDARSMLRGHGLDSLAELLDEAMSRKTDLQRRDMVLQHREGMLHVAAQVSGLQGDNAGHAGTLLMVEDLSDLIRAQRTAAWREVAQRIAHEIKNPLTPIQLSAERLRKKFAAGADDLDRVLPEATASIEREVRALKHLVDEFSRFARMPEVAPRPVDFQEVVDSVVALYEGLPGIDWELEFDPQIGEVVLDPEQIRRALINLIDNAIAALEGSGKIALRVEGKADNLLRIEVADSGPGIPAKDRDRMFVPYFSTKKRGTGLGLAIVHKVITDHRGTIRVEDNEPQGARFVIEIPA